MECSGGGFIMRRSTEFYDKDKIRRDDEIARIRNEIISVWWGHSNNLGGWLNKKRDLGLKQDRHFILPFLL